MRLYWPEAHQPLMEDTLVRFERDGRIIEQRLDSIKAVSKDDWYFNPRSCRTDCSSAQLHGVFGATAKVSQVSFETGGVSLAEAMARVQGPSDSMADPTAVFIFRYDETIDPASGAKPVIYRLNMITSSTFWPNASPCRTKTLSTSPSGRQPAHKAGRGHQPTVPAIHHGTSH
jgi:hypothetical protein